jgi:hypothetical protein
LRRTRREGAQRPAIREVYGTPAAASEEAVRRFFGRVEVAGGVFKTTAANRLDDVNAVVRPHLPPDRPLELMDVAVSSGATTCEWSQDLAGHGIEHHIVAGDRDPEAVWLSSRLADLLIDADGHVLYADVLGRGLRTGGRSVRSREAMRVIRGVARSRLVPFRRQRVELVVPELLHSPRITLVRDDIFEHRPDLEGRFHALRAANILNRGYFDDDRLRLGLRKLQRRLVAGGLLIVCRTLRDGTNDGTLFREEDGNLRAAARLGAGSELDGLIG